MNWRRAVRYLAAAVGIGCAVALFALYRPRPEVPPPPPSIPNPDPNAKEQGFSGKVIYKGKSELDLFFEREFNYADGRTVFEKTHVVFTDKKYEVWADRIETRGNVSPGTKPTSFDLSGNVKLVGQDGMSVQTAAATYDDATGILLMPGDVAYTRGRLSGTGVGGTYNRTEDSMRVADKAVAHVAPDDTGAGAAELTSTSMSLMRAQHSVHLDGNATIKSEKETLSGDNAIILFTDDEQAMKFLELRGHASVLPTAAAKDRPTDMRADNITLTFQPDGSTLQHATLTGNSRLGLTDADGRRSVTGSWIDLFTASDGKTLTRLDARDRVVVDLPATKESPARTIRAASLTAKGEEATGLQNALFNGDVTFEEREAAAGGKPAATRTGKSAWLMLQLAGDLDAVTDADFRNNVEFVDGTVKAYADIARYEVRNNILRLFTEGTDGKRPRVEDDGLELTGGAIVVRTNVATSKSGHDLNARGTVTSKSRPSTAGTTARRSSSLFDEKREINGSAEEVIYAGGETTYIGAANKPAELYQDKNRIVAMRIAISQDTGNLVATGTVETRFACSDLAQPGTDTKAPPGSCHVTASKLDYDDARRIATYTGQPVVLETADVTLQTERVVLTLGEDSQTLEKMDASGREVYAKLKEGHEFLGVRLQFDAATGLYELTGAPARLKAIMDPPPCKYVEAPKLFLDPKTGASSTPGNFRTTTEQLPCATPLREIRR